MNFVRISHLSIRAACPTQVFLIYFATLIIFGAESDTKDSSLCGVVQSTALPICYTQRALLCVVLFSPLYFLSATHKGLFSVWCCSVHCTSYLLHTKDSSLCGVVQSTALPICYTQIFPSTSCSNTPAIYIIRTLVVHTIKKNY